MARWGPGARHAHAEPAQSAQVAMTWNRCISMTTLCFHSHCHLPPIHGNPQNAQAEHPLTSQQPAHPRGTKGRSVALQAWLSSVETSTWLQEAEIEVSALSASPGQHAGKIVTMILVTKCKRHLLWIKDSPYLSSFNPHDNHSRER